MSSFKFPSIFKQANPYGLSSVVWVYDPTSGVWTQGWQFNGVRFTPVQDANPPRIGSGNNKVNETEPPPPTIATTTSTSASHEAPPVYPTGTQVTVADETISSLFPPVSYDITCQEVEFFGGYQVVDYIVKQLVSFNIYDPTRVDYGNPNEYGTLINKGYAYITTEAIGPIRSVGSYSDNNTSPPRLVGFVTQGEILPPDSVETETLTYAKSYVDQTVYLSDPREDTPLVVSLGGKYVYADVESVEVVVERADGLSEDEGDFSLLQRGTVCLLTVRDRSGVIFQQQYNGYPSVNLSSLV